MSLRGRGYLLTSCRWTLSGGKGGMSSPEIFLEKRGGAKRLENKTFRDGMAERNLYNTQFLKEILEHQMRAHGGARKKRSR